MDSVISVNQSGNVNATFNTMEKAIASGQIKSTEVDPKFSAVYFGGKWILTIYHFKHTFWTLMHFMAK